MKPDEEMHAGVEEVKLEPCDLFTDIGTLVIEGRAGSPLDRGHGQGVHCPPVHGPNRHVCDSESPECQQYEQLHKYMLLLWKNGIPMSVEVLLYPECCRPQSNCVQIETSAVTEVSCLLLEQWTMHMLPRRVPDASMAPRGLIQAVRSFLHFSQLSAWLSLSKGKTPLNVHYRVCVPGEAFSSKFERNPEAHSFPVANIGRSSAMKVTVKNLPRCGEIPQVPCQIHGICSYRMDGADYLPMQFAQGGQPSKSEIAVEKLKRAVKECPSSADNSFHAKSSSPVDSLLGDSLLDPPQSLHMYPKRYQSPSRCGSPSLEVPEHLMFGTGATTRKEAELQRLRDRSRPQRRPVVERFLNKQYGTSHPSVPYQQMAANAKKQQLDEKSGSGFSDMTLKNSVCFQSSYQMPSDEMDAVLDRLKQRFPMPKNSHSDKSSKIADQESSSYLLKILKQKQESMKSVPDSNRTSISSESTSVVLSNPDLLKPKANPSAYQTGNSAAPNVCSLQSSPDYRTSYPCKSTYEAKSSATEATRGTRNGSTGGSLDSPLASNSGCSAQQGEAKSDCGLDVLMNMLDTDIPMKSEEVLLKEGDERMDDETDCPTVSSSKVLCNQWRGNLIRWYTRMEAGRLLKEKFPHLAQESEGGDRYSHMVPSAADKAKFRRSLDSATSMVFHQNTGLPLTSSPAPIRKSGTCFDFDSSLTSVSAIKKALFEKDPESEEITPKQVLSTSAPALTTSNNLLGNFEESVLNGRIEPVSTVEGFTAEIGASGSFCPRHKTISVTVFFYTLQDIHKVTSPYLGHINLGKKGYMIPRKGTVQVTLFNPHRTVVKMFVVRYDLSDMPPNSQTFLRQRTLYMPTDASEDDLEARKWLRYLIHLRFASSKSNKIYLHTDIRAIVFRKSDLDAATIHGQRPYELRSFTQGPKNPKFSPCK